MKFLYEYRTRDNRKQHGAIEASDRESAFQALKARGIRPSVVREAPGMLNKWLGKGKRWTVIVVLSILSAGLLFVLLSSSLRAKRSNLDAPFAYSDAKGFAVPIERRQIWGDSAVIEQAQATDWRGLFANPAEQLLALYAQPGVMPEVFPQLPETLYADMEVALNHRITIAPYDLDEYRQMKCIVEGLKDELRAYLLAGGTVDGYLKRLNQRQREEVEFIEQAKNELTARTEKGEDLLMVWQDLNRTLREQGLRSIPLPTE